MTVGMLVLLLLLVLLLVLLVLLLPVDLVRQTPIVHEHRGEGLSMRHVAEGRPIRTAEVTVVQSILLSDASGQLGERLILHDFEPEEHRDVRERRNMQERMQ